MGVISNSAGCSLHILPLCPRHRPPCIEFQHHLGSFFKADLPTVGWMGLSLWTPSRLMWSSSKSGCASGFCPHFSYVTLLILLSFICISRLLCLVLLSCLVLIICCALYLSRWLCNMHIILAWLFSWGAYGSFNIQQISPQLMYFTYPSLYCGCLCWLLPSLEEHMQIC